MLPSVPVTFRPSLAMVARSPAKSSDASNASSDLNCVFICLFLFLAIPALNHSGLGYLTATGYLFLFRSLWATLSYRHLHASKLFVDRHTYQMERGVNDTAFHQAGDVAGPPWQLPQFDRHAVSAFRHLRVQERVARMFHRQHVSPSM